MVEEKIAWPAIEYASTKCEYLYKKYGIKGIPSIVLLGSDDSVLECSYENGYYKGVRESLAQVKEYLKGR